jgi:threonine dehydrogenase-like Zn-dependent dehydrogenase
VVQGLTTIGLRMGETVLVQGAGGLGLYACAVAKHLGAGDVIAVDSVASRLELARAFGADHVIDLSQVPDSKDRIKALRELTGGWGADVVCEFVGNASVMKEGVQMLAPGGRYLEVGCINTGTSFELDPAYLTLLNRSIVAVGYYEPWALRAALEFLARAADDRPWDRLVAERYPLARINEAFEDAAARRVPRAAIEPALAI